MKSWKRHRHVIATMLAASISWSGIAAVHPEWIRGAFSGPGMLWFAVGLAYTHVVEYGYHRFVLHRGLPFLRGIQRKHLEHHRLFHGNHFATSDPDALSSITGDWFLFPTALALHFLMMRLFLEPSDLTLFLAGVVLHYLTFEVSHYFAHVCDNGFDRLVRYVPLLREIRALQLRHHRRHHETPEVDFNFNPPFAVDVGLRTFCVGSLWTRRCAPRRNRLFQGSGPARSSRSG